MIDLDAVLRFDALLDLSPAERDAAVEKLRRERPDLASAVSAWLAADGSDDPRVTPAHYAALLPFFEDEGPKTGDRIGPYRLLRELGHGGMGSVWLAERAEADFQQQVALKLIRPDLATPEAEPRFRRERQILASLKHPNIAQLLDGGLTDDGRPWLAMEYVEGHSLRDLVEQGPLPPRRLVPLAAQLTSALAHAHAAGVVHRDLKPDNVLVAREGYAKILDFGIAKMLADDPAPDTGRHETKPGQVIGTLAYMSPEQASGDRVDFRSDQFSFGALMYEAATGTSAFSRATPSQTIAAVLRDTPPALDTLAATVPEPLVRILRRCLEKDPADRYGSTHDLARDLADLERGRLPAIAASVARRPLLPAALLVAAIAIAAGAAWWAARATRDAPPARRMSADLPIAPAENLYFGAFSLHAFALSPDGRRLVYAGYVNKTRTLLLRDLDSREVRVLPGTEGAYNPEFSPDGEWLVFFAGKKLRKSPVHGGGTTDLAEAPNAIGGIAWTEPDTITFSPHPGTGIWRVSARGGELTELTKPDVAAGEGSHVWPAAIPGSPVLLYTAEIERKDNFDGGRIYAFDPRTRERTLLVDGGTDPQVVGDTLYYARAGTIYGVAFDRDRLAVRGSPQPVYEGVMYAMSTGAAQFAAAGDVAVHLRGAEGLDLHEPVIVHRDGKVEPMAMPRRFYDRIRISPDGRRVLFQITGADDDIWTYDLERQTLGRVTDRGENLHPAWTPDGRYVVYSNHELSPPPPDLYRRRADGVGEPERLIDLAAPTEISARLTPDVSPDGSRIAYAEYGPADDFDIWLLDVATRKATPWLKTPNNEQAPRFSPDGRWIAYVAYAGPTDAQVHLRSVDGESRHWQLSTTHGLCPSWRGDGREVYFSSRGSVYAVSIAAGDDPAPGQPQLVYQGNYHYQFEPFPDGQRFLTLRNVPDPGRAGPLLLDVGPRELPRQ